MRYFGRNRVRYLDRALLLPLNILAKCQSITKLRVVRCLPPRGPLFLTAIFSLIGFTQFEIGVKFAVFFENRAVSNTLLIVHNILHFPAEFL